MFPSVFAGYERAFDFYIICIVLRLLSQSFSVFWWSQLSLWSQTLWFEFTHMEGNSLLFRFSRKFHYQIEQNNFSIMSISKWFALLQKFCFFDLFRTPMKKKTHGNHELSLLWYYWNLPIVCEHAENKLMDALCITVQLNQLSRHKSQNQIRRVDLLNGK